MADIEDGKTRGRPAPVAPWWHTLVILLIFAALAGLGALSASPQAQAEIAKMSQETLAAQRMLSYWITIGYQWIVVLFIWWGLALRKVKLSDITGVWPRDIVALLRDLGIGILFMIVARLVLTGLIIAAKVDSDAAVDMIIPRSVEEMALFLAMSATAGICEEIIFRGYLQRQFSGWTGSAVAGLLLQSAVFGVAHAWQGWIMAAILGVFGLMFGLLAVWRRSLSPGIFAHVLNDALSGLQAALGR